MKLGLLVLKSALSKQKCLWLYINIVISYAWKKYEYRRKKNLRCKNVESSVCRSCLLHEFSEMLFDTSRVIILRNSDLCKAIYVHSYLQIVKFFTFPPWHYMRIIHKLRLRQEWIGGFAKCQLYFISLFTGWFGPKMPKMCKRM